MLESTTSTHFGKHDCAANVSGQERSPGFEVDSGLETNGLQEYCGWLLDQSRQLTYPEIVHLVTI